MPPGTAGTQFGPLRLSHLAETETRVSAKMLKLHKLYSYGLLDYRIDLLRQ